jgi:hypothetical protein
MLHHEVHEGHEGLGHFLYFVLFVSFVVNFSSLWLQFCRQEICNAARSDGLNDLNVWNYLNGVNHARTLPLPPFFSR